MARNAKEIPASTVITAPFLAAASLQTSESLQLIINQGNTAFVRRFSVFPQGVTVNLYGMTRGKPPPLPPPSKEKI